MTPMVLEKIGETAKRFKPFPYVVAAIGTWLAVSLGALLRAAITYAHWGSMLLYLSFSTSACLLGLWLWLGTIRWPVRVAVVIAGIAVIEELDILATGDALASFTLVFPIGVIVLVWTVLDLLKIRLKLVPTPHMTGDGAMSVGSTRFYILDLLLWAMAAGLLLGVARSIKPEAVAAAWTVIQQIGVVIFVAPSCACLRVLWLRFGRCSATHN